MCHERVDERKSYILGLIPAYTHQDHWGNEVTGAVRPPPEPRRVSNFSATLDFEACTRLPGMSVHSRKIVMH
jgi:hypothetical protein|tara:strand:- start:201 stop:416 length:216 start_codon:yes stop_codon:yes gene_type:complete